MNRYLLTLALAVAFGVGASNGVVAQTTAPAPQNTEKKEEPKKDPRTEEYEKAIKDLKKLEGGFTLYQRKKDILLELPESKLNELFLVQAAFHTGPMADGLTAGFPADGFGNIQAFRFERNEDTVLLVRPNLRYRWDPTDPYALASERSFPPAILQTFRIENTNPDKKLLLVNIGNLFYGDSFRLNEMIAGMLGGPYGLERDKSGPEFVKSYPDNTVVRMKLHYFNPRPGDGNPLAALLGLGGGNQLEDDRSAPIKVTYNMWWRKKSDYMPRQFDPRVGYFTTDYFNISRFSQEDRTERLINRWNLKKKDPKAAVSEPVKPIVWVIDDSIPPQFRQATKDGILFWNQAFEKLGYKNAVQVIDKPNDPDWDHADGRYNVARWTMSEDAGYAIALFRTDPFTGEILNASVNFDANMAFYATQEYTKMLTPAADQLSMVDRALKVLTKKFDHEHDGCCPSAFIWDGNAALQAQKRQQLASQLGWRTFGCNYSTQKAEHAGAAWQGLLAVTGGRPKISQAEYLNEFIRDVTSHEIGHTMGLRHNFISSKQHTTEQLADAARVREQGITTSVMEYTPVNTMAVLKGSGVFYAPKLGTYDLHAIRYGYMDIPGATSPVGEKHMLSRVASLGGQPQYRWMTDENADTFDPNVVRFDMAKDQLNYSMKNIELARKTINYAITKMPENGKSYADRTNMLLTMLGRLFREGSLTARFVGGLNGSKNFRGDVGESPTLRPVSANEQRAAVRLIAGQLLSPDAFTLPANVKLNMTMDHNEPMVGGWTAPLRQTIASRQAGLLASLMSNATIQRVAENQYKWSGAPGAYTMDEHYATLMGAVFREIGTSRSIPDLRRDLQRFAVNALIIQSGAPANAVQEDARMLATDTLRRLSARYGEASKQSGLNGMTAVYLRDTKATIDRFLNRTAVGN